MKTKQNNYQHAQRQCRAVEKHKLKLILTKNLNGYILLKFNREKIIELEDRNIIIAKEKNTYIYI